MDIFIYSDESGVFDKVHNDIFVFGGLILLSKAEKDAQERKYSHVESVIRSNKGASKSYELKSTTTTNKEKGSLFRSLNQCNKFGVIIDQNKVLDSIFGNKKSKQRYLDYAYKIGVKRALSDLIEKGFLDSADVDNIFFFPDEHTTATDGRYELREALTAELKYGTYNFKRMHHYPPLFPDMESTHLHYCNSRQKTLVRAADIIAGRIAFFAKQGDYEKLDGITNLHYTCLP